MSPISDWPRPAIVLAGQLAFTSVLNGQVYDMRQLNTEQIRGLDLNQTVVLMSAGILEQHGPYLPSYTDGYVNEFLVREIAQVVVARPGWSVLVFPPVPLGVGGANQIGFKHVFPGTYHVHFEALRTVFMDLAAELGEDGFKWVFVVSRHGNAAHKRALDQASEFFNDTYPGTMVHLDGVIPPGRRQVALGLTDAERIEAGFDPHAGLDETSRMLFLRPDLVRTGYLRAEPQTGSNWTDLVRMARRDGWQGYLSSPRLATAARGSAIMTELSRQLSELVVSLLDGLDPRQLSRTLAAGDFSATADPGRVEYGRESDRHDAQIELRKKTWLARKGY